VLSFGGTKNGAVAAEAVIVMREDLLADVPFLRKQQMQLGSKMRFMAAQFSALLEDIRIGLAKKYLGESEIRLEQLAYLMGYSEPAPFVRAFKRWTGTTPMQFRSRQR